MKCIGIVDITTIGACICANEIVAAAARKDPSGKHPEFIMHAFSFDQYKTAVLKQDWHGLAGIILKSIDKLKQGGADFIIIPSNTPHYGIERIQEKSPLPVLNLIDITVKECQRLNFKKAAILGTKATMQNGLYAIPLNKNNIEAIIPDKDLCERIDTLIMNEIIPSKIDPKNVQAIAEDLKKIECDVFILGCTELPEVYHQNNLGKPVIDTTRLLAHRALAYACE